MAEGKSDLQKWPWWITLIVAVLAAVIPTWLASSWHRSDVKWHDDEVATQEEAAGAVPSALIDSVGTTRIVFAGRSTYDVARTTTIAFRFHPGKAQEVPLIVVHSLLPVGTGWYYPIDPTDPVTEPNSCPDRRSDNGDSWWCVPITVGAPGDTGAIFTIAVWGVPAQVSGVVHEIVSGNVQGQPSSNHWANIPDELGDPLSTVTVKRD